MHFDVRHRLTPRRARSPARPSLGGQIRPGSPPTFGDAPSVMIRTAPPWRHPSGRSRRSDAMATHASRRLPGRLGPPPPRPKRHENQCLLRGRNGCVPWSGPGGTLRTPDAALLGARLRSGFGANILSAENGADRFPGCPHCPASRFDRRRDGLTMIDSSRREAQS